MKEYIVLGGKKYEIVDRSKHAFRNNLSILYIKGHGLYNHAITFEKNEILNIIKK